MSESREVPRKASGERASRPVEKRVSSSSAIPPQRIPTQPSAATPGRQVRKPTSSVAAAGSRAARVVKPKAPSIDEAKIMEWLGATEENVVAQRPTAEVSSAKLYTSVDLVKTTRTEANSKQAARPLTDDVILSKIGDRLVERGISAFTRLGIDIKSGTVTVSGTVASQGEKLLLLQILQTTPGVTKVKDALVVERGTKPKISPKRLPSFSLPSISISLPSFTDMLGSTNPAYPVVGVIALLIAAIAFFPRGNGNRVAVHPVKGRVTLQGEPLAKASVVLHPMNKSGLPNGVQPRAVTDDAGNLTFTTFSDADGAPNGDFVATVYRFETKIVDGDKIYGPNELPSVYSKPDTSPLHVTIASNTKEITLLELKRADGTQSARN